MTRVNTVDLDDLADQHLMAEYSEIPMVPGIMRRSLKSKKGFDIGRIPEKYTLNGGHIFFFYNKGKFCHERYLRVIEALKKRNYNIKPEDRNIDWDLFKRNSFYNDWEPDDHAHKVNVERILQRISLKPEWYRYKGGPLPKDYIEYMRSKYIET